MGVCSSSAKGNQIIPIEDPPDDLQMPKPIQIKTPSTPIPQIRNDFSTKSTSRSAMPYSSSSTQNITDSARFTGDELHEIPPRKRQFAFLDGINLVKGLTEGFEYVSKSPEIYALIKLSMTKHPIFSNMNEYQTIRIIDAMKRIEVHEGTICCKQGETGRSFYSIEKGTFLRRSCLDPIRNICEDCNIGPGDVFGDMFLYNTPRKSTVTAITDGVVWAIDRYTYRQTLELYEREQLKERLGFISKMDIFASMTSDEKVCLSEACATLYYEEGETIIKRGTVVDDHSLFYIIKSGQCKVIVPAVTSGEEDTINILESGQFFGERALMTDEPRSTDIIANTDVVLFALDRESFNILLGPINNILSRTVENYGKVVLKDINIFTFLTQEERETIFQLMNQKEYNAGQLIYEVNQKVNDIHIIMEGEVYRISKSEEEKIIPIRRIASSDALTVLDEDSSAAINLKQSIESPKITSIQNTFANSSSSPTSVNTFTPLIDTQGKTRKKKNARIQSELYYMEKNKIEYQRRTSDVGNSLLQKTMTEILGKGDYFGGSSILNNKCKSLYRYVAHEHTVCLTLSKEIFEDQIVGKKTAGRYLHNLQIKAAKTLHKTESALSFIKAEKPDDLVTNISELKYIKYLGRGSFGVTILAENQETKAQYAIKCIPKSSLVHSDGKPHKDLIVSVLQEKNMLMTLPICPFYERCYGTAADGNNIYFILEYLSGGELTRQMYNRHGVNEPLKPDVIMFYASSIVLMMSKLHDQKIAYRDLKPENIMVDYNTGYLKLIDFGFAKYIHRKSYTLCGTPDYIAPEILCCTGHDLSCDWWSFGIICYELVTGKTTFSADNLLETYRLIIESEINFNCDRFSEEMKDLIIRLLCRKRIFRLGNLQRGSLDIKEHRYFEGVDWDKLEKLVTPAPKVHMPAPRTTSKNLDPFKNLGEGDNSWINGTGLEAFIEF